MITPKFKETRLDRDIILWVRSSLTQEEPRFENANEAATQPVDLCVNDTAGLLGP